MLHREALVWQCDNCKAVFESDHPPPNECPECDYYHCGDFDCCAGEGFIFVQKVAKTLALD